MRSATPGARLGQGTASGGLEERYDGSGLSLVRLDSRRRGSSGDLSVGETKRTARPAPVETRLAAWASAVALGGKGSFDQLSASSSISMLVRCLVELPSASSSSSSPPLASSL
jgi:hypothetical protein